MCTGSSNATQEEANSLCNDLTISLSGQNVGDVLDSGNVSARMPSPFNYSYYILTVTWKADSTVTLSGDVTVSVGESTFVYSQK